MTRLVALFLVSLNCFLDYQFVMSLGQRMLEDLRDEEVGPRPGPSTFPSPRPTTFFDPLCNDGRIKEEQDQACLDYGSDHDCCEAFRLGSSCKEGGQFYPGSRRGLGVLRIYVNDFSIL